MKTKILKLLQEAKTQKEIDEIVDKYPDAILVSYELMDALKNARARVVHNKSNKREWEVYELN